jgi:Protein of unknown function (DUF1360)
VAIKIMSMILHFAYNNWAGMVIAILCVWRITSLICYEAGPFSIFIRLRKIMYKLKLGELIECFHCVGIWIAIVTVLLIFEPGMVSIFEIIAIAGGASLLERFIS